MRRISIAIAGAIIGAAALSASAFAQVPWTELAPGARDDYRFDYRGDGSAIKIGLNTSDPADTLLAIYDPAKYDALKNRGENPTPAGIGTPSREFNLAWSGGFRGAPGTYHVFVENRSSRPIFYKIEIGGEGVTAAAQVLEVKPKASSTLITESGRTYLAVNFPPNSGAASLRILVPPKPAVCTHANQIPAVLGQSIKLCPGETYPPLRIVGSNIALYGDDARSSVITSNGRQFALTIEGSNNWVEGVTIQARTDPRDTGAWMCLYDECIFPTRPTTTTLHGGLSYGGGILLKGSNSTIRGVTVRGGAIGIATVNGRANNIIDNQLTDLAAWGSYNVGSIEGYFVGNVLSRINHGCTTPDGKTFKTGCETSGWVCLGCQANIIVNNFCELSGNCFYISGDRGLTSNYNRFIGNYCAGASENCFEITFSLGNLLADNVGTIEFKTNTPCKYPYWIGGSVVSFQNNKWQCTISANEAFEQSRNSTVVATNILNLDAFGPVPIAPLPRGAIAFGLTRVPRGERLEPTE